jgi:hypothetical protein
LGPGYFNLKFCDWNLEYHQRIASFVVVSGKESGKKREKCLTLSFIGKKVRFDRTALFYCKMRKQSVKDSGIKSSPL